LTKLELSDNNIGPEGAKSLAAVLGECNALAFLDLSVNEFGDTGLKYLASVLGQLGLSCSLTILKLRDLVYLFYEDYK
jgi:Ran GTPase-activating protein (RanGAP) involved in mRNA processing and transport